MSVLKTKKKAVTVLSLQSENHAAYKDAMNELKECMNNVFSNTDSSISFDEFLKKLEEEIEKI